MTDGREIADFNDAIGYLTRINQLFLKADISSGQLDVFNWFHALMGLYRELSTKMKPEELTKFKDIHKATADMVNNHFKNPRKAMRGQVDEQLYNQLHNFEMELRQVYKASGLEMRFQEDGAKALR